MAKLEVLTEQLLEENKGLKEVTQEGLQKTKEELSSALLGVKSTIAKQSEKNTLKEKEQERKSERKEEKRNESLIDSIKGSFEKIQRVTSDGMSGNFTDFLGGLGLGATFTKITTSLSTFAAILGKIAFSAGIAAIIGTTIYGAFKGLMHGLEKLKTEGFSLEWLAGTIGSMLGGIVKVFRDIGAWILDFFGFKKLAKTVENAFGGEDILDHFYDGGKRIYNSLVDWTSDIFEKIGNFFTGDGDFSLKDFIKDIGIKGLDLFKSFMGWQMDLIGKGVSKVLNGLKSWLGIEGEFSITKFFKNTGLKFLVGFASVTKWIWSVIGLGLNKIVNGILGFFGFEGEFSINEFLKDIGLSFIAGYSNLKTWIWELIKSVVFAPINAIKNMFKSDDPEENKKKIKEINNMISNFPSMVWNELTSMVGDAIQFVKDKFGEAGKKLASFFGFGEDTSMTKAELERDARGQGAAAQAAQAALDRLDAENDLVENTKILSERFKELSDQAKDKDNKTRRLKMMKSNLNDQISEIQQNINRLSKLAGQYPDSSDEQRQIIEGLNAAAREHADLLERRSHIRDRIKRRESDDSHRVTLPTEGLSENEKLIVDQLRKSGFNMQEIANVLGQVHAESKGKPVRENMKYTAEGAAKTFSNRRLGLSKDATFEDRKAKAKDLLDKDKTGKALFDQVYKDMGGSKYRGRGFIQLTGRENYKKIGDMIDEDLVNNPQLMLDPKIAAKATAAYFKLRKASGHDISTTKGATRAVAPTNGSEQLDARRAISENRLIALQNRKSEHLVKASDEIKKKDQPQPNPSSVNNQVIAPTSVKNSTSTSVIQTDKVYDRDIFRNLLINDSIFGV